MVLRMDLDAGGLDVAWRRVWRRARAWAAVRVGEGVGVVVVGLWVGVGWAAISDWGELMRVIDAMGSLAGN